MGQCHCSINTKSCTKVRRRVVTALDKLLLKEQDDLKTERQELRDQISAAESRLKEVTERLGHVEGLLEPVSAVEDEAGENPLPNYRDIRDIAADVLRSRGGDPLHYTEIAEEIQTRGGVIPGIDAASTLLSRLVRDARFVRPKRGHYALREHYPDTESVGSRRRRVDGDNGEVGAP